MLLHILGKEGLKSGITSLGQCHRDEHSGVSVATPVIQKIQVS